MIKKWKKNSIIFIEYTIFNNENIKNKNDEIIFREFKYYYSYESNKTKLILNKYGIWIDDINISHKRI